MSKDGSTSISLEVIERQFSEDQDVDNSVNDKYDDAKIDFKVKFSKSNLNDKKDDVTYYDCCKLLVLTIIDLFGDILGIIDLITDIGLLIKSSNIITSNNESIIMLFPISLFIGIIAPYIISYSSGIKLFLLKNNTLNNNKKKYRTIFTILYLLPTGILYFIVLGKVIYIYIYFHHAISQLKLCGLQ